MWNNISTLAEKRTGMEGLNSTYYNLIAKKPITTVRPLRAFPLPESVNSTDVEEDKDNNVTASQPDETFVRQNRHKRTRPPEQVRPRTNPDSAATDGNTPTAVPSNSQVSAAESSSPVQLSYSQGRLKNDLTKLSQESGTSQGINNAHSFPRDKLPYSPPSVNNLIEDLPKKVVTRAQSQPFTGIHSRMVAEILKTPTRSDFRNILGQRSSFHTLTTPTKPKPRVSPCKSESDDSFVSSRSVFDVEEDSKFEFYVEDQESSEVKTSPKEDLGATEIQRIPIPAEVCSKISANMELNQHHDSEVQPKEIQIEDKVPEIAANVTTTSDNDPDFGESSLIFYSNPRYGSRYACKDTDVINSVVQRNYASTEDSIPEEITTYGIKPTRYTASAKLYKEMSERITLKPVRRCYSAYAPPPEDTESVEDMDDVAKQQKCSPMHKKKMSYKDSTQFLFPPVLSESSFTSIPSKRKSRDSDIEDEDEDNDYEAPDPDMKAIREYNIKLVQGEKNTGAPTSSDSSSLTHRRVGGCDGSSASGLLEDMSGSRRFPVRSRSSIVTNIPCDSWMMFPLRVLPGGMVPWGLLLFVPLIIILVVVLGYFAVTLFPFKII